MLVRTFSKTNGLAADDVVIFLKSEYPDRQWVGSSKLASEEISKLNRQFSLTTQGALPQFVEPELQAEEVRSQQPEPEQPEPEQPEFEQSKTEQSGPDPAGQLRLPQSNSMQLSEMAQALQFMLTQQSSISFSDGIKADAAGMEGASTAYQEFMAYRQGYATTAKSLHELQQAMDMVRYQQSSAGFNQVQQDFLSSLRNNSEQLQASQANHQQLKAQTKASAIANRNTIQDAIKAATDNLKNQASPEEKG